VNITFLIQVDFLNAFMINTVEEGYNSGRIYYLQASSKEECNDLVKLLKTFAKRARERSNAQTRFAKVQLLVRKAFNSYWFQTISAILIIMVIRFVISFFFCATNFMRRRISWQNFLVSIFEAQFGRNLTLGDGSSTKLGQMTDQLNLTFSIIFIFELLVNILGHWPKAFMSNPWVRGTFQRYRQLGCSNFRRIPPALMPRRSACS
jgi:hypothetical protein